MSNNIFYDLNKILSYNALLNLRIGERGVGKTYSTSKFVTNKFIKNKYEFAYIRRYKSELKESVPKFFESLKNNNEFPGVNLSTKGNKFYCNGEVCRLCYDIVYSPGFKIFKFFKCKIYYI